MILYIKRKLHGKYNSVNAVNLDIKNITKNNC